MVIIDIKIARRLHRKVDERMLLQKVKHMVEETDARIDGPLAGTVKVQAQGNPGFLRISLYHGFSHVKTP